MTIMLDGHTIRDLQPVVTLGRNQHHQCGSHPRWRVIRSRPQAERQAHRHLSEQGYLAYLPMFTLQVPDRVVPTMRNTVERPLFASYLFVQLNDRDPTFPISATYGVAQLLPGYARNGDVEALQAGDELRRQIPAEHTRWAPGMACSLASGSPLSSLPAFVTEVYRGTVSIAVMFLGQIRHLRNLQTSQITHREA